MKKLLIVLFSLFLLVGCAGNNNNPTPNTNPDNSGKDNAPKTHLDAIKAQGYFTIGTEGEWAPWTYEDATGTLVGYDVEVGKAIAEKLGVEARFIENPWDGLLIGLETGKFDIVINGVDITEERSQKFNFSVPYAYSEVALIVAKDNEDINSLEDLNGKTFANSAGSSYEALGESYGATNNTIDTFTDTMSMIEQGRVDATINSYETYMDYMSTHPESNTKLVAVVNALDTAIPFVKGDYDASFLQAVNDAIEDLRADGTLAEISNKYFGKDISVK